MTSTVLLISLFAQASSISKSPECKAFPGGNLVGDLLVIINKNPQAQLQANWRPNDLVRLPADLVYPSGQNLTLRRGAAFAFKEMRQALLLAIPQGDIKIHSAFRPFEEQCRILTQGIFKYTQGAQAVKKGIITPEVQQAAEELGIHWIDDLQKNRVTPQVVGEMLARRFIAEPGRSQHQLGTTIDIAFNSPLGREKLMLKFEIEKTKEYKWLAKNAHFYGFALSYPNPKKSQAELDRDKSRYNEETGYYSEPWHWRYIGVEAATELKDSGLTLDAYLLAKEQE